MQHVFFSGQNTFHTQLKIPRNITHELSHNHSRNPRNVHPFLCVGPYKNTCNNFGPFLDIHSTTEVFSSGFFQSSHSDQVLLLSITTPQNQNSTTLFNPLESLAT